MIMFTQNFFRMLARGLISLEPTQVPHLMGRLPDFIRKDEILVRVNESNYFDSRNVYQKFLYDSNSWGLYYKTFYGRNLRISVIS